MEPRIQYAKTSDGVSIAYAVSGDGPALVIASGTGGGLHVYSQVRRSPSWTDQLVAEGWKVLRYDGRGMGSSDRDALDFSLEARLRDLEAVVHRVGLERFALHGRAHGTPVAVGYSAEHPERVSHLILASSFVSGTALYQNIPAQRAFQAMRTVAQDNWEFFTLTVANSALEFADSEAAKELAAAYRTGMSPAAWVAHGEATEKIDLTLLLESLSVPTMVLNAPPLAGLGGQEAVADHWLALARKVTALIPNARLVVSEDHRQAVEAFLQESGEYELSARSPVAPLAAGLVTILFTDVEGSTALTERLGDAKAREVLREHERITREALKAHGGSEVKTMGDGFMASFGSATKALECAVAIERAFANGDIRVRIGLNAGEPIAEDDPDGRSDLFGTAVIVAARIAAQAGGGEILVSDVVRQLVAGKGFRFADHGAAALKGFEEPVRLFEVEWND